MTTLAEPMSRAAPLDCHYKGIQEINIWFHIRDVVMNNEHNISFTCSSIDQSWVRWKLLQTPVLDKKCNHHSKTFFANLTGWNPCSILHWENGGNKTESFHRQLHLCYFWWIHPPKGKCHPESVTFEWIHRNRPKPFRVTSPISFSVLLNDDIRLSKW